MPTETDLRVALHSYASQGPELDPWPEPDRVHATRRRTLTAGVASAAALVAAGVLIGLHEHRAAPAAPTSSSLRTHGADAEIAPAVAAARAAWIDGSAGLAQDLSIYGPPTSVVGQVVVSNADRAIVTVSSSLGDARNNATEVFIADVRRTPRGWSVSALRYPYNALNIAPTLESPQPPALGGTPVLDETATTRAASNDISSVGPAVAALLDPNHCHNAVDVELFTASASLVTVTSTDCPPPNTKQKAEAILIRVIDDRWAVTASWDLLHPNNNLVK